MTSSRVPLPEWAFLGHILGPWLLSPVRDTPLACRLDSRTSLHEFVRRIACADLHPRRASSGAGVCCFGRILACWLRAWEKLRQRPTEKMFYAGYGYHGSNFEQTYRCYPASFFDKPHLEGGDKVIMPPSALDRLASLHIEYPMLFELHNDATHRISHCGVLEFVAEEGMIIMPYWMMQNMLLQEGDTVRVKNTTLPKGTYVKLQPHTTDFLDISNPKAILEKTLRNFSCLTTGDSIMVAYNNKQYYIDIVETKPASAVSIIETDCEVDFAPPLDYKEPEKPQQPSVPASEATAEDEDAKVEDELKFKPFTGSGKRLDGKASKLQATEIPSASRSSPSDSNKRVIQETVAPASSGASNPTRQKSGKLVFGSSANNNKEPQKAPVKDDEPPKDEPKFQAFSGKSYSLKR